MDESQPMVSVCIQTYNHGAYIEQCLESIINQQTNFSFEIILGEDESTDGTREICKAYASRYPHLIRLFLRSQKDNIKINGRATGRFNMVQNLKEAKGKYVACIEGDDYWSDTLKLAEQVKILELNQDVVLCHTWQELSAKNEHGVFSNFPSPKDFGQGYSDKIITDVSDIFAMRVRPKYRTLMFRNLPILQNLPDWFTKVQFGDEALNFVLGKYGKFYFIDEPMAVYRIIDTGASSIMKSKEGFIQGTKAWLIEWAYASGYHDHRFRSEALEGMTFFVQRLYKRKDFSQLEKRRFKWWLLNERQIPWRFRRKLVFI